MLKRALRTLLIGVVVFGGTTVVSIGARADPVFAGTSISSQAVISAASKWLNMVPYCFDGGGPSGPSHGAGYSTQVAEGATDCLSSNTIGFDCTGLTEYAIYQASGGAVNLAHSSAQATSALAAGGTLISNAADLLPGDLVYFGGTLSNFDHSGIYLGNNTVLDANVSYPVNGLTRPDGVHEEPLSWEYPFVGGVRLWNTGSTTPGPSASTGFEVAFQANNGSLYTFSSSTGPADQQQGMMAGTSPSIAALPTGGYEMAFQANTGNLFVFGTDGSYDTGQGMMAGTSPSIAASPSGGFEVAFQANNGSLYTFSSSTGPADQQQGMMAGTSPSIAALPTGGYEMAFQANTGNLFVFGTDGSYDTGQGMMTGTSSSIAASPSGGFEVAFQANNGSLYTFSSSSGPADQQQGMMAGTGPSIAALPTGGYEMAFQANTGNLFVFGSGGSFDTQQGMFLGSSPCIGSISGGGYEVAFQANTGNLFVFSSSGTEDTQQGMMQGTSPGATGGSGAPSSMPPVIIATTSLPGGSEEMPYAATLTASGGRSPYNWSATGLPLGLSLNAATGSITGTSVGSGIFPVQVTVHDSSPTPLWDIAQLILSVAPSSGSGVTSTTTTSLAPGSSATTSVSATSATSSSGGVAITTSQSTTGSLATGSSATTSVSATSANPSGGVVTAGVVVRADASGVGVRALVPRLLVARPAEVNGPAALIHLACKVSRCSGSIRLAQRKLVVSHKGRKVIQRVRMVPVGSGRFNLTPGHARLVRVVLRPFARTELARLRSHRLVVRATVLTSGAKPAHSALVLVERPPAKKKK